jgi:hypothetical protein
MDEKTPLFLLPGPEKTQRSFFSFEDTPQKNAKLKISHVCVSHKFVPAVGSPLTSEIQFTVFFPVDFGSLKSKHEKKSDATMKKKQQRKYYPT